MRDDKSHRDVHGFTLTELTIVLVIVALLVGGLLVPLSAQRDMQFISETRQQLDEIRDALIGFALVNGRLPRPATSIADGAENPTACSSEAACTGYVPWATLGLKKSDAWNKMIGYSVTVAYAGANTGSQPFALSTARTKKIKGRDAAGNIMYLAGSASDCTSCTPAAIYSFGKNNWGAAPDGAALADASASNADEDANANAASGGGAEFFARDFSDTSNFSGGEFDDIVVWIPPYILFNRMAAAGKLP